MVVATSLPMHSAPSNSDDPLVAVKHRLDGGVADAGGLQMAGGEIEAVGEHADDRHADHVLGVGVARQLGEKVLGIGQTADEGERGEAGRRRRG